MPLPAERPWMDAIRRHVEQKTFVARSKLLDEMSVAPRSMLTVSDFAHESVENINTLLDNCEDVLLGHRDVVDGELCRGASDGQIPCFPSRQSLTSVNTRSSLHTLTGRLYTVRIIPPNQSQRYAAAATTCPTTPRTISASFRVISNTSSKQPRKSSVLPVRISWNDSKSWRGA